MTESDTGHQLRAIFGEAPELYERARPGYPPAAFDALAEFAGLEAGARVLEIGCGTGQATLPLAERGYHVTAVELAPGLAAIARRKLARFEHTQIVVSAFEDWPLPPEPFDAVVSATAFHWLERSIRVAKSAAALRPGGTLATIATHHIAGGDAEFFVKVQDFYERWDPATPPGLRLQTAEEIPLDSAELENSGLFGPAHFQRYAWSQTYTTDTYRDLLLTYSGHRALEPTRRQSLLDCITHLIATRFDGHITKRYLTELRQAHRHELGFRAAPA